MNLLSAGLSSTAPVAGTTSVAASHSGPLLSPGLAPALPVSAPFPLSSSFPPPIPAKLVAKIKALHFVELKELLPDNNAALEQNVVAARPHDQLPEQREIASIPTWVSAFTMYTAIVTEA